MTYFKCRRALPRDGGVTLRQVVGSSRGLVGGIGGTLRGESNRNIKGMQWKAMGDMMEKNGWIELDI